ncbi:MAG: hypothetical protein ABIH08_07035 [Candidatus Omnitrophota bacterium]|nr:hypothetical protein [Candidatus Omnitrophota bacterium]
MHKHKEEPKINCLTFRKQEFLMKDITEKINQAEDVQDKAMYAQELLKKVDTLFSCPDFKEENIHCKNCRFIANLRRRTADLIIKAKKLE